VVPGIHNCYCAALPCCCCRSIYLLQLQAGMLNWQVSLLLLACRKCPWQRLRQWPADTAEEVQTPCHVSSKLRHTQQHLQADEHLLHK
jgi:hypothetical protein